MGNKTLFLAWQDKRETRRWYPVGKLDVIDLNQYRFVYVNGALKAKKESGFEVLYDFPVLDREYKSSELFPLFKNRILTSERTDFKEYLKHLALPERADPLEILSVDGGYRATDTLEVFPKIAKRNDGAFLCRFFLHGVRYVSHASQKRLESLLPDEKLFITLELTNPIGEMAIQIQTSDYHVIGWAPRYLVPDLAKAIVQSPSNKYKAKVVRINPIPAPSKQRLLIELCCHWPDYEPMTNDDFEEVSLVIS